MERQRWDMLRSLFDTAADLPPADRDVYLRLACTDVELRQEVAGLLVMDGRLCSGAVPPRPSRLSSIVMAAQVAVFHADPRVGTVAGGWQLLRVLGEGADGVVYLAEQAETGIRAAVKRPRIGAPAREYAPFRVERDVLQVLRQPGIVALIDADLDAADGPQLVLEYINGRELRRHCMTRAMTTQAFLQLFLSLCDIVARMHAAGVAHCDLRADNILVTRCAQIRVVDFGRAVWLSDEAQEAAAVDVQALVGLLVGIWALPAWRAMSHASGDACSMPLSDGAGLEQANLQQVDRRNGDLQQADLKQADLKQDAEDRRRLAAAVERILQAPPSSALALAQVLSGMVRAETSSAAGLPRAAARNVVGRPLLQPDIRGFQGLTDRPASAHSVG